MNSRLKRVIGALFLLLGVELFGITQAGTIIGNVATAIYYDESNNRYVTTSNLVQTVVSAVYGVQVQPTEGITINAVPNSVAYVPFLVVNTGNTAEELNITVQNSNNTNYAKKIYIDKNQNGLVDPGEVGYDPNSGAIVTLSAGEALAVIVEENITNDTTGDNFELNATNTADPTVTSAAKGAVNVYFNIGVMVLRDSVDKLDVRPGEELNYTVNYKNIGNQAVFGVSEVIDGTTKTGTLIEADIPTGTVFSKVGNGSPTTNPTGYWVYKVNGAWTTTAPTDPTTVSAVGWFMEDDGNGTLAADQEGVMNFYVKVVPSSTDQTDILFDSNTTYAVSSGAIYTLRGNQVDSKIYLTGGSYISITPTEGNITLAAAGTYITFEHTITNSIAQPEIINFRDVQVVDSNGNPVNGAVVEFYRAGEMFKYFDTDGDGYVDTGEIGEGNTTFVVSVFIPQDVPAGADYKVEFNATASYSGQYIPVTDYFDVNITPAVDFGKIFTVGDTLNDQANGIYTDGSDDVNEDVNNTVYPGQTATYLLQLVNEGGSSDMFDLSVQPYPSTTTNNDVNFTANFYIDPNHDGNISDGEVVGVTPLLGGTFLTQDVAAGATSIPVHSVANFEPGDTIIVGTNTTNAETATIQSVDTVTNTIYLTSALNNNHSRGDVVGETLYITLKLTPDQNTTAGARDLEIKARSKNVTTWAVEDTFDAALKIKAILRLILQADQSDQLEPGGTTTYKHVIINGSNTDVNVTTINVPSNGQLIYEIIYVNNYGVNQTSSPTANVLWTLKPGESHVFWVKVFAPSDVEAGTVEAAEINVTGTATDENGTLQTLTAAVTDTTTVIRGFLLLTKDVNATQVKPGSELNYTIVAQNIGKQNAVNIRITDQVPNHTTFVSATADLNCDGANIASVDTTNTSSATDLNLSYKDNLIEVNISKLTPAQKACINMIVKVK